MRIRFLIENGYVSGGTVRTTVNTAGALAKRGHKVEIISVHRRRRNPFYPPYKKVELRPLVDIWEIAEPDRLPEKQSWRQKLRTRWLRWATERPSKLFTPYDSRVIRMSIASDVATRRWIKRQRNCVLVSTRPGLNIWTAKWAHSSVVTVGQDHLNYDLYEPELLAQMAEHYPKLDALSTLTRVDLPKWQKLLGRHTQVVHMPNGVPEPKHHVAEPGVGDKVVIAAGRLGEQKGYDLLVDAWRIVVRDHPDWRLEIYGSTPEEELEPLQELIEAAGVTDSMLIMGLTKKLSEKMAAASIFVLSSRFEGLPMVLLEAMRTGLPVVSFDCPTGPRDVIDDGVDGILVPDGDTEALGRELSALIDDDDRRRALSVAARKKGDQFDVAELAARWEQVFEDLWVRKHGQKPA